MVVKLNLRPLLQLLLPHVNQVLQQQLPDPCAAPGSATRRQAVPAGTPRVQLAKTSQEMALSG